MVLADPNASYAKCVEVSKRIRWDIDKDVIRNRILDTNKKFLPDSVSLVKEISFLQDHEQILMSQIQGRTYAHMFGLVERFITAHTLKLANNYWTSDQDALQALVGFSEEELKHQELFIRLEKLAAANMAEGYEFVADINKVADNVLRMSSWTVLALTSLIEHFTQAHYRESLAPDTNLSELFKDVFLFHWREESQHTVIDELEWRRINADMEPEQRDQCVNEFIELLYAMDVVLQDQATADSEYFISLLNKSLTAAEGKTVHRTFLKAYRWLFIDSGLEQTRFCDILHSFIDTEQQSRIKVAILDMREIIDQQLK